MSEVCSSKKTREDIWMDDVMRREIGELMGKANATSRSDFVRQAVKFYCGYLRSGKDVNFLAPVISQTVKGEVRTLERNLSQMLFKLAVEVGMNSHITAATNEITQRQMDAVRRLCAEEVAETNGVISFEKAYDFQDGGADA